jgi:hypothetical protein
MLGEVLKKLQAMPVEQIEPTGAKLIEVSPSVDGDTEWVTWTGTYYPTLESVPWQARGSAIEVPATR